MTKEWVGCIVCGKPFERDILVPTSPDPMPSVAICNVCIRRKDLDEVIPKIIQSLKQKVIK